MYSGRDNAKKNVENSYYKGDVGNLYIITHEIKLRFCTMFIYRNFYMDN